MGTIVFAIEMGENHASSRPDRVALAGTGLLVVAAAMVAVAVARGPLSTERVAAFVQHVPRVIWLLLVSACAAPAAWLGFRGARPFAERAAAALALVGAWGLAWCATAATPRFSFDAWERALSSTAAGVPWGALFALIAAAAVAASFGMSLRRVLLARGAIDSARLSVAVGACAFVAFALPASAVVYLATGTRIVPVGEPDDPWAPAFVGSACPPPAAAVPKP